MKDRAEFVYKMRGVSKQVAHWHVIFDLDGGRINELDGKTYFKEKRRRDERTKCRAKVLGYAVLGVLLGVLLVIFLIPHWMSWFLLVGRIIVWLWLVAQGISRYSFKRRLYRAEYP
jgi:polyferredoxin